MKEIALVLACLGTLWSIDIASGYGYEHQNFGTQTVRGFRFEKFVKQTSKSTTHFSKVRCGNYASCKKIVMRVADDRQKNDPRIVHERITNDTLEDRKLKCVQHACLPGYRKDYDVEDELQCEKAYSCVTVLPQHATKRCAGYRRLQILTFKKLLKVTPVKQYRGGKLPSLILPLKTVAAATAVDDISSYYFYHFRLVARKIVPTLVKNLQKKYGIGPQSRDIRTYISIYKDIHDTINAYSRRFPRIMIPSSKEKFIKLTSTTFWRSDKFFTQQLLAGMNPYSLRRVDPDDSTLNSIMTLSNFKKYVNKRINSVVKAKLKMTVKEAVEKELLYVASYPELKDWKEHMDIIHAKEKVKRKDIASSTPIGIFASVKKAGGEHELEVIAIQSRYGNKHPLVTPGNTYEWVFHKFLMQSMDYASAQVIEHLFESHLRMEQYCLAILRGLPMQHPLYRVLRQHCNGLLFINTLGRATLVNPGGIVDQVVFSSSALLQQDGLKRLLKWTYGSGETLTELKSRGVMNKKVLPYYPYRDDSLLHFKVNKKFARDIVQSVYKCDSDVVRDHELQAIANSLSADGVPVKNDLKGTIVGFPAKFKTQGDVTKFLVVFLSFVLRHNLVNFPILDYGAAHHVHPSKLYHQMPPRSKVTAEDALKNLGSARLAIAQGTTGINLGGLHLDSMFDYEDSMPTPELRDIVRKYHLLMMGPVTAEIRRRNNRRFAKTQLTYPYSVPAYMSNSINV